MPAEELHADYPTLPQEAIPAALAYAAELARDTIVPIPAAWLTLSQWKQEPCIALPTFQAFWKGVALHLAYSLIRDISHATARRFELHSEHLKRYFHDLDEAAQQRIGPAIAELDLEIFKLDRRLEPTVSRMIRVSIVAAIYGICLLAYVGFSPETRFSLHACSSCWHRR